MATICPAELFITLRTTSPRFELASALVWWNSSIASSASLKASSSSSFMPLRSVAWAHTNILALFWRKNSMNRPFLSCSFLTSVKLKYGGTSQLAKKPPFTKLVFLNERPMLFSGTATTTFLMPWFANLSSAINIKARLLPDAGGALMSKKRLLRCSYARACISRIPNGFTAVAVPVCWYLISTMLFSVFSMSEYLYFSASF